MALETETGTGSATAESFCSVADADTYHAARGTTLWATLTTACHECDAPAGEDCRGIDTGRRRAPHSIRVEDAGA